MLGFAIVGASSGPPDSITTTCAPDADNSAARTEPAAPAPTTMKSYRFSSFDTLIILNSQGLGSAEVCHSLEMSRPHEARSCRVTCVLPLPAHWATSHEPLAGSRRCPSRP